MGRVVLADLLDRPAIALGTRVHDDDTVERCMDLAHALQTNLDGHVGGDSCFLSGLSRHGIRVGIRLVTLGWTRPKRREGPQTDEYDR